MKLSELELVKGDKLIKDGEFSCFGLLNYFDAPPGVLSFYGNKRFASHLNNELLTCVICKEELVMDIPAHIGGIIVSGNPLLSFWQLNTKYGCTGKYNFDTRIGNDCEISKFAHIASKGVVIGDNVKIEEFVSIKKGTTIGSNTTIKAGTVIGGSCLELSKNKDALYLASLYGGIDIGENIYIGYNNTFIRGTFEWKKAVVGDGSKIDSNNFISHNVRLGNNTVVTAGVVINGDVTIGNGTWISPGVNVTNSVDIGQNVNLMLGSKVLKNVKDDCAIVDGRMFSNRVLNATKNKGD